MWRNYDWQCKGCGAGVECLVEFPQGDRPPSTMTLHCQACGVVRPFERLISMPAQYMGEKPRSPRIYGGSHDTMGYKREPRLEALPEGLNTSGMRDFFARREYRETQAELAAVRGENAAKRVRGRKLQDGANIDFRRDRLPGDPKL